MTDYLKRVIEVKHRLDRDNVLSRYQVLTFDRHRMQYVITTHIRRVLDRVKRNVKVIL